jgi:hypothetical protein
LFIALGFEDRELPGCDESVSHVNGCGVERVVGDLWVCLRSDPRCALMSACLSQQVKGLFVVRRHLFKEAHPAVASLRGRSPLQVRWTGTPRRVVRLEVGFGERGCAGLSPSLNGLRRQTARASTNTINPPAIRVRNVIDARSCAGSANGTSGLLPCFVS